MLYSSVYSGIMSRVFDFPPLLRILTSDWAHCGASLRYRNLLKAGLHGGVQQPGKAAAAERGPSGGDGALEAGSAAAGVTRVLNSGQDSPGGAAASSPGAGGGGSGDGARRGAAAKAAPATPTWSPLAPSCLDDLHKFRALPTQQSVTFQMIDLQLTEVQEALQEAPPSADASRCSEKTGWFVNATLQRMQAAVQQRFLQLMERMAPPGVGSGATGAEPSGEGQAAAAVKGGGGAPSTSEAAGAAGAARRGSGAAAAGPTSTAAAGDGGDGDVEMLDASAAEVAATRAVQQRFGAATTAAAATRGRGGGASGAAAADEALRALMAQMNLRGLSTASGENDVIGVAGLFGSDDEGDDFQLLDEQEDQDDVDGRVMDYAEEDEVAAVAQMRNAAGAGADTSGGRDDGGGGGGETSRRGQGATRDAEDADDSAFESEYDIGMGDEYEEDDDDNADEQEEEEEEEDGAGGVRRLSSLGRQMYRDGTYGRVTVPFDGSMSERRFDNGGGMFGTEDDGEDEPY
ncbi:hypothetical protein Vafri_7357 [Volvox africanus]|uniref:Uncharacterized protein n=2 Tax=Volvox africanus TaxID=51714 RepID=A0A8J4EXP0_9CHLO|nr:hypothetical protein Vafri_7357 [Volvox africanus]